MANSHLAAELVEAIKQVSVGAVNATKPMQFSFGVVESSNPLRIRLNQKMVLPDEFLILTNAVKDHSVDITVSWNTLDETEHVHGNGNNGSDTEPSSHKHGIQGRKKITIHNGLTAGEKVLLFRVQGGQHYVVIDRVDEIVSTGESV